MLTSDDVSVLIYMADVDLNGRMVLGGDETTRSGAGSGVSCYAPHKEFQNRWINVEARKLEGKTGK